MSSWTNYAENQLVDFYMRAQTLTLPSNWFIAAFTAAPGEAGGGTEVSGGSYARVSVARSLAAWSGTQGAGTTVASTGTGGESSNNAEIAFPTAAANWGDIVGYAFMDASTGGNMWNYVAVTALTINTGDTLRFPAGTLKFTGA